MNPAKKFGVSSFVLHCLAMTFMLCDHLWGTFLIQWDWLTFIGRIAFPIFAFLLAEGFRHTKDRKKYALRILIFAVISELPFNLTLAHTLFYPFHQNVLWTFLLAIGLMSLYEQVKRIRTAAFRFLLYALLTMLFYIFGFITFVDYFGYGILTAALFYFTHSSPETSKRKLILLRLVQLLGLYWINCEMMGGLVYPVELWGHSLEIPMQGFALLSLPLLWLYNGEHGKYNRAIRFVYYSFYPLHLLILGALITYL